MHNGRVNGDLGVSRSIGDIKFKAFDQHTLQQPLLSKQLTLESSNADSGMLHLNCCGLCSELIVIISAPITYFPIFSTAFL